MGKKEPKSQETEASGRYKDTADVAKAYLATSKSFGVSNYSGVNFAVPS
jgi:hypothetical protein